PMGPYARTYTKDRRDRLLTDLRTHFAEAGADSAAELLLKGMNLRNTPLLDAMIKSRGEDTVFQLRGKQKEVAEDVLGRASLILGDPDQPSLMADDRRAVFIVTGGAGTGKSAVGLELKAEF
ncbi:AAA family ATPase, partial [Xylella fastidiosa subsp. multiplex]|nr:AAA family ATPase [Xylella fastidiosa subsp. multiplex]